MVYRVYVEKKEALANEARALLEDLRAFLGIQSLTGLRLFNRYDLEGINRELFDYAVQTVLSEPQLDTVTSEVPQGDTVFAVEYLPGQYDQRADSAAQCIQILSQGERPTVRTARVYVLEGELTAEQVEAVKKYVINPVESREASLELPETLRMEYDIPTTVRTVEGFTSMDAAALDALRDELGLAMDLDDLKFLQGYFRDDEGRDPTITEIRVVDTYWSDHCRHTTFSTHIDQVEIHDAAIQAAYERYLAARVEVYGEEKAAKRPQTLMDIATIGAKVLKKRGLLPSHFTCMCFQFTSLNHLSREYGYSVGNHVLRDFAGLVAALGTEESFIGSNGAGQIVGFFRECNAVKAEAILEVLDEQIQEYNSLNPDYAIEYRAASATSDDEKEFNIRDLLRCAFKKLRDANKPQPETAHETV